MSDEDPTSSRAAYERSVEVRNILNRVVPVVNDHERRMNEVEAENVKLRRQVAELSQALQRVEATLGPILARHMGTGATSTNGG